MPTGYTAKLAEGEQPFEEFVWRCARAMGALVMMREEPFDAPIPERFEPDSYYLKQIDEKRAELARIEALSLNDAAAEAFHERKAAAERAAEYAAKRDATRARYEAMRAKVQAWTPPTPDHLEFKNFMLDQIANSMRFDCGDYTPAVPEVEDAEVWKTAKALDLKRGIAYAREEYRKEVERAEARTRWVAALRDSLKEPVPA